MIGFEEQFEVQPDDGNVEKLMAIGDLIHFIEGHQRPAPASLGFVSLIGFMFLRPT
jgi:hypothetical protein